MNLISIRVYHHSTRKSVDLIEVLKKGKIFHHLNHEYFNLKHRYLILKFFVCIR
jgi:hypothetical protein